MGLVRLDGLGQRACTDLTSIESCMDLYRYDQFGMSRILRIWIELNTLNRLAWIGGRVGLDGCHIFMGICVAVDMCRKHRRIYI